MPSQNSPEAHSIPVSVTVVWESTLSPHCEFLWTMKRPVSQTTAFQNLLPTVSLSTFFWHKTKQKGCLKNVGISFRKHLCQSCLHLWLSDFKMKSSAIWKESTLTIRRDDIQLQLSNLSLFFALNILHGQFLPIWQKICQQSCLMSSWHGEAEERSGF